MNNIFKTNSLRCLSVVYLIVASILDKSNILSHIQITLLISALTLKSNKLTILSILSNGLYWLAEYSQFTYLKNLMASTLIFAILAVTISFLHNHTSLFTNEVEDPDCYFNRIIEFLKVFILPFIIYLISFAVVYFIRILDIEALNKIAIFVNGLILVLLTQKQLSSIKDDKQFVSANWLKDFITKIYVPISIGLMSVVALESIYFISISKHMLSYEFELGVFTILILNNIVIESFIHKEKSNSRVIKSFRTLEILMPVILGILMLKHQFDNGFAISILYLFAFSISYVLWKLNKFNKKTFLTLASILYFFPIIGLVTNPIREAMIRDVSVKDVIAQRSHHHVVESNFEKEDKEDKSNLNLMREESEIFEKLTKDKKNIVVDDELEISIENNDVIVTNLVTNTQETLDLFNGEYIGYKSRIFHTPILITSESIIKINYVTIENDEIVDVSLQITDIR